MKEYQVEEWIKTCENRIADYKMSQERLKAIDKHLADIKLYNINTVIPIAKLTKKHNFPTFNSG